MASFKRPERGSYGNPDGKDHLEPDAPSSRDNSREGFHALKKLRADYSVKTAKAETEGRKEVPKAGISSRISALAG